jgi:hypothetical protein
VLSPKFPAKYNSGGLIPVVIRLTSVATGQPITDGHASIAVVRVLDANGNPTNQTVLSKINAFTPTGTVGDYKYTLNISNYPEGTYTLTLWGTSFPATQGQLVLLKK